MLSCDKTFALSCNIGVSIAVCALCALCAVCALYLVCPDFCNIGVCIALCVPIAGTRSCIGGVIADAAFLPVCSIIFHASVTFHVFHRITDFTWFVFCAG